MLVFALLLWFTIIAVGITLKIYVMKKLSDIDGLGCIIKEKDADFIAMFGTQKF